MGDWSARRLRMLGGARRLGSRLPPALATLGATVLIVAALGGCSVDISGDGVSGRDVQDLVKAVAGGDDQAAAEAAAELAKRKDAAAAAGLAAVVRTQSGPRARLAVQTLEALGPAASAALVKDLEYEQPDRSRRQLKAVLAEWARQDKATVRLLVTGLGKKYQHWWTDDVLVKAGGAASDQVAAAMQQAEPKVAMRCACVLARLKDRRAVPYVVDGLIDDRGYDGATWDAAKALDTPVVARLVRMSRGGDHSVRAAFVLANWVLGIPSQLSKADKDKAREAVIAALYRSGDTDLGFAMWDEGDPVLTKGAQEWAHSQGKYFYRQGD